MRNERIERERDKSFSVSGAALTDPMVNSCCNNK